MKFGFGNIVAVEENTQVGIICKLWKNNRGENNYDVYVRSYNKVINYKESEIRHFIYNKEIQEEDQIFYLSNEDYLKKQGIDPDEFMKSIKDISK